MFGGYMGAAPAAATPGNVGATSVLSGDVGAAAINSGNIASGQIGGNHVASGRLTRNHLNSGTAVHYVACEQAMSGVVAVAWGSGRCFVVPAERSSGLRMPAIGVVAGNFVSGDIVPVVTGGFVHGGASGVIASGQLSRYLYVGSGGLIIDQSGYHAGASSGHGAQPTAAGSGLSGILVQRIGAPVSGGIFVSIGEPGSGLVSGTLSQY